MSWTPPHKYQEVIKIPSTTSTLQCTFVTITRNIVRIFSSVLISSSRQTSASILPRQHHLTQQVMVSGTTASLPPGGVHWSSPRRSRIRGQVRTHPPGPKGSHRLQIDVPPAYLASRLPRRHTCRSTKDSSISGDTDGKGGDLAIVSYSGQVCGGARLFMATRRQGGEGYEYSRFMFMPTRWGRVVSPETETNKDFTEHQTIGKKQTNKIDK